MIFDEENQESIKKLLHNGSNQKEEAGNAKSVVSMPRFLEMPLKDLFELDPAFMVPRVENGFKTSVPFGLRFLMHETEHTFEASMANTLKSIIMDAKPHRSKWVIRHDLFSG